MKKILSAIIVVMIVTACSSSAIKKLSDDTYVIYKEDHRGVFGSASSLKAGVINEANDFAAEKGGVAIEVLSEFHPVGILGDWATYKYEFRVATISRSLDKTAISNVSSRCLIDRVIDYDDGIANVDAIAKAVARKCYKHCVTDIIVANNMSVSRESSLYESCKDQASDAIFQTRHIKREGGEVKRYGSLLYIKRRGDSHYKILLSAYDTSNKIEFLINCQKGIDSINVNMHNIEISGLSLFEMLKLNNSTEDLVQLNVNDEKLSWYRGSDQEEPRISIPSPRLNKFFPSSETLIVGSAGNEIEFYLGGYRDALKEIESECPTVKM